MKFDIFELLKKKQQVVQVLQKDDEQQNNTSQELFIEIAVDLVNNVKDVDKELNRSIPKQYKQHKKTMSLLYKYYLINVENGILHENHSIVTEEKGYKYIFFSVPFISKFYFIIYRIDDETIVLDKVKQRVTELSIPPRDVPFEEIKELVKNLTDGTKKKDAVYIAIIAVTLGVISVGGYELFIAKPNNNIHSMLPINATQSTAPSSPPPPPTFSPIQEHYALALAEYKCFRKMDNQLTKLKHKGVIVKQVSIRTSTTPQSAVCSYIFTEDYTYPAVGTTLNGKYYERTSLHTVTVTYQDFIRQEEEIPSLIQNADFLKCMSFLKNSHFIIQSRPSVLQASFVFHAPNNAANASIDLYKVGQFLYDMEDLCGYNVDVNNVQIFHDVIDGDFVLNWDANTPSQQMVSVQPTQPINAAYTNNPSVPTTNNMPTPQPSSLPHNQSHPQGTHPINVKIQVAPAHTQNVNTKK